MSLSLEQIDILNKERIATLHIYLQPKVEEFLNLCYSELGIKILVTTALRTFDEQRELFAQGRTKLGKIVTKARPGQSLHQYGLAFDHVPLKELNNLYSANWDFLAYNKTIAIAERSGFESGSKWHSFKDIPHLQMTGGWSWSELLSAGYGITKDIATIPIPK